MKNNDIIVQVDESTKELMQNIQAGLSTDVKEQISKIQTTENENSERIGRVIRKLNGFDGMNTSLEELKKMAQETNSLKNVIPPISESINDIRKKHDTVIETVNGIKDAVKQNSESIGELKNEISKNIDNIASKIQNLQTSIDKLQCSLDIVINLTTPFWKKIFKK